MKNVGRRSFLITSLSAIPSVMIAGSSLVSFKTNEVLSTTKYGRVKGYDFDGVKIFRGIPYGDTTAGERRFLPPMKPKAWTGVKDCTLNGPRCYQGGRSIFEVDQLGPWFSGGREDRFELSKQASGEDCLNLNVLTRGLRGKRPVMVYIHGGGYQDGGGLLAVFSDRHVREQDVVLVGINHRLNVFGYTYLGGIDEKYKIGNPGQLDLVAALEWVRDNIVNFGGDPENIMIFGESGGAGKICTLLAMPSAKGLFHKAAIMSGAAMKANDPDRATASAKALMDKLGVTRVKELLEIPGKDLMLAGRGGGPVIDGHSLLRHPFYLDAPDTSAHIPLLIGCCKDETTLFQQENKNLFNLDEEELRNELIKLSIPESKVDELLMLYKRDYPENTPSDLYFRIATDCRFRSSATKLAELQLAKGKAKVWMYYSQYNTPIEDGKLRAFHTYDLPLAMRLTLYPEAEQLSQQMSEAWANFARKSNPGTKKLPWPEYSTNGRATMVFDVHKSEAVDDPNRGERIMLMDLKENE